MTEENKKQMYEASKSLAKEYENDGESKSFSEYLGKRMSKEEFVKKMRADCAC